jgi:Asp-tRNA(Asn)/Glu-tRNA(Gln) amidotransferase A subunit family amidase
VDVVRSCLERIERLNPELNAFITVLNDEAMEQAGAAESDIRAGKWRGPLHGIPVGIKDFSTPPESEPQLPSSISGTAFRHETPSR